MAKPQDMHSVDSFSQLPFIRPAPPPARDTIRLFGYEFSNEAAKEAKSPDDVTANGSTVTSVDGAKNGGTAAGVAERKFECHYCCRNFPTSQALGGHQNAHKRERQHAKRAHLQASLAVHRYMPGVVADHAGHMYGLFNYHHVGRFEPPMPPPHYPMWTSSSPGSVAPAGDRFHSGLGSVAQPINGNPVPGIWRVSPMCSGMENNFSTAGHAERAMAPPVPPVYGQTKEEKAVSLASSSKSTSSCSSTSPEKLGRCEFGQKDGVSLDLHL